MSAQTNNMPEICGRICPQDRLCEGSCVIEKGFESVTIGAVEKHITETAFENGWVQPPQPVAERAESVGIIGAGPAGLAAADMLRQTGYQVTIYDRYDRVGGLLIYGIPICWKSMSCSAVTSCSRMAASRSVNCDVGTDITFDEIRQAHDAVLIATGVYKARDIGVPGSGLAASYRRLTI